MATLGRRRKNKSGRANAARLKFAKWFGTAVVTGVLMTTPNFINNKGGYDAMAEKQKSKKELSPEQEQKLEKLGKESADLFLKFIKTGDSKYYEEFDKIRSTKIGEKRAGYYLSFTKPFEAKLDSQAKNDPGLKAYLNAYNSENEKFYAEKFFKSTNELMHGEMSLADAESKYGKATVYSFTNMITWRLAAYAAELSIEAFDPVKSENTMEKMEKIAGMEILGVPLTEFDNFIITYDNQVAKRFAEKPELAELWNTYEANVGEEATMRGLVTELNDCAELISKGKKKAIKKYGEDFVAAVTEVVSFTPKKTEKAVEEKTYSNEELVALFNESNVNELISYLNVIENPICNSKKEGKKKNVSDRIKFMQLMYNELLLKDKEFQQFLKQNSLFKKLKGKKTKINGKRKIFVDYLRAINYFLKEKAQDPEFKGALVDAGIYPGDLNKNHKVTETTLKALSAYLGIFENAELVSLEEQVGVLSSPDRKFYDEYISSWLADKQAEGYTVLNLEGIVDYLVNEVRNGKKISKLDTKLHKFQKDGYMIQTIFLEMKPSKISNAILSGKGVADALDTLFAEGQGAVTRQTPSTEEVRILAVELLLDNFVQGLDEYFPADFIESTINDIKENDPKSKEIGYLTTIQKKPDVKINGEYGSKKEIEIIAVKAIQTLLFEYSRQDDAYNTILEELGIDYSDLKATGKFDKDTATAFAAYISYKKGTWEDEKGAMLAEKVPEEKPEAKKPGKKESKEKKKEKPKPDENIIIFR